MCNSLLLMQALKKQTLVHPKRKTEDLQKIGYSFYKKDLELCNIVLILQVRKKLKKKLN